MPRAAVPHDRIGALMFALLCSVLPASLVVIKAFMRFLDNKQNFPLSGNVLSVNTKAPWLTYTEWAAAYGYGDEWRRCRRLLHQIFRLHSALKFRPMQIKRAHEMIVNLIDDPHSHFATFSASITMPATYGHQTSPRDDPLVRIVENAVALAFQAMTPERAILLKFFPFWRDLQSNAMLSNFGQLYERNDRRAISICTGAYAINHMVVKAENSALGQFSMVAENLQQIEMQDQTSRPLFEGSYETTISFLMVFALAMVSYPNVQKRAQVEIDSAVGRDRLPTFEDRALLPYLESVLRETLRWQPIGPIAPRATSSDGIYDGYFIPKALQETVKPLKIPAGQNDHGRRTSAILTQAGNGQNLKIILLSMRNMCNIVDTGI
ncbi:cytochrome P450 [Suillus discolor]|uniref:Cytochrome P450 n=1 Tax=Suillus discolor TaxID=1912936 RepID=A0A9P7JX00_9AGAM|nr:cytochrome P450 [Suillus discolor]KAG2113513.1 cytochrome P450 [Suillus discolor]